jgi:hypothetical protein
MRSSNTRYSATCERWGCWLVSPRYAQPRWQHSGDCASRRTTVLRSVLLQCLVPGLGLVCGRVLMPHRESPLAAQLLVRNVGVGDRDDAQEGVQAGEVGRVGGEQGQVFSDGGCRDSSARVIELIAISSGSSPGSIHRRRIRMLVSSRPCQGRSLLIRVSRLMLGSEILIGPECVQVDAGSVPRHRGELLAGDETAAASQRDQFPDAVTVPGNRSHRVSPSYSDAATSSRRDDRLTRKRVTALG